MSAYPEKTVHELAREQRAMRLYQTQLRERMTALLETLAPGEQITYGAYTNSEMASEIQKRLRDEAVSSAPALPMYEFKDTPDAD
jgi:hypothetical protein